MKLTRKIGEDLGLKTNAAKVAKVISHRPGQHGAKGRKKLSDFGQQLREKQKLKFLYGVTEKQLRRIYDVATKNPTATGAAMLALLERRLDNVVYRLGWAPTRAAARQLVNHGHMTVNGRKMDIPSYTVAIADVITFAGRSVAKKHIAEAVKNAKEETPAWIERKQGAAKVLAFPRRSEIREALEEQLIVEYFSR
jgi:small subunit ribosomal protein S4